MQWHTTRYLNQGRSVQASSKRFRSHCQRPYKVRVYMYPPEKNWNLSGRISKTHYLCEDSLQTFNGTSASILCIHHHIISFLSLPLFLQQKDCSFNERPNCIPVGIKFWSSFLPVFLHRFILKIHPATVPWFPISFAIDLILIPLCLILRIILHTSRPYNFDHRLVKDMGQN